MIRNTTLEDSGYYAGGVSSEAAWMEGGVVLIVLGKFILLVYVDSTFVCTSANKIFWIVEFENIRYYNLKTIEIQMKISFDKYDERKYVCRFLQYPLH